MGKTDGNDAKHITAAASKQCFGSRSVYQKMDLKKHVCIFLKTSIPDPNFSKGSEKDPHLQQKTDPKPCIQEVRLLHCVPISDVDPH